MPAKAAFVGILRIPKVLLMKILICRVTIEDGSVRFAVYDTDEKQMAHYTNSALTPLVVRKDIYNAKLENSVIKTTDGSRSVLMLDREESSRSSVIYILSSYTSELGSEMYAAVDNLGEVYEFSANLLHIFMEKKQIVNMKKNRSGHEVIKVPVYASVLQKSLEHTNIH